MKNKNFIIDESPVYKPPLGNIEDTYARLNSIDLAKDNHLCSDYDSECKDVECKTKCYIYDAGKGLCPYLWKAGNDK